MSRLGRAATGLATVAVLSLTAGGCVTVHGELEVVPSATRAEAEQALRDFTDAYNAADKAYDPALDAGRVTGALGAINQAGLKSRSITAPGGNPRHRPLELSDTTYHIPKKAGWPRFFVVDADSNRDVDSGDRDSRWLMVFVRNSGKQLWEAAYLAILSPAQVPEFRTDEDGWAEPVAPDSARTAVAPQDLSEEYASYLRTGSPQHFADGTHTSEWRRVREQNGRRPGLSTQYVDQPLDTGDFAPLGLATEDGGALVFFALRYFDRQTAAQGYRPKVSEDVKALMTGEVKNTLTKEWVSSQAVAVAPKGAAGPPVRVLNRLQGVTGARGS
ncbi:hypothetical protein [Streptomyces pacificus]|uniref:DUF8094 domain-containing protein n=1 Tax=Streptomyces pacificus TaxID=2705029 RepID=A0A6A0APR4_9ACTN|nr:hypothetical protein [Streptomyces pacificus]GFH34936.1 hypothetical protein SCWH03_11500 [Streptomyces pacificus]